MSVRGVKCPLGWTLVAENIENVERVTLDAETQRELGCLVGEHVFLEYPWAYAKRNVVARLAERSGSTLAAFKDEIDAYESDHFLIGYASSRLNSDEFAICLTEEAKRLVVERNRNISRRFASLVLDKVRKIAKPWNSLGSESEVNETFATATRELFEIEISIPGSNLNAVRNLGDRDSCSCRDSYVELVTADEVFANIDRRCVSRTVQTHRSSREAFVQTYPGHPKNAWTQYAYEDTLNEPLKAADDETENESERNDDQRSKDREDQESVDEPPERTPLELFLEARSTETIDAIRYNAAVNVYVDDIEDLARRESRGGTPAEATMFHEHVSFVDLDITGTRAVSDVSVPSRSPDRVAIAYASIPTRDDREIRSRVLVWRFEDPLRPQLQLRHDREVCSVSFCPFDDRIVIGGCSTGRVIIWNTMDRASDNGECNLPRGKSASAVSVRSHRLPVRRIEWMPVDCRIEPNGKPTKSSVTGDRQFLTASEDGTVAVWRVDDKVTNADDEAFQPILRLRIPLRDEESGDTSLRCFCPASSNVFRDQEEDQPRANESNSWTTERACSLWIGCADGLVRCTWDEQLPDEGTAAIECKILSRSCAHDGPVIEIARSPHLQDTVLTIGGRVFAVWKDDCSDTPLFHRRTNCRYTGCCWTNEPGVFVLAGERGELELWDIKNEPNAPIFAQTVSSGPITVLRSMNCIARGELCFAIGVGDQSGFFRAFEELRGVREDTTVERMDWFEEYAWREVRRKKIFTAWQNDFLANDPTATAKRSARRDRERERETEETRARLRREQEERERSKEEKRPRTAPRPNNLEWTFKEYERMKTVLLSKRNLIPAELEAKRLPLIVARRERDAKLQRTRDEYARRETYFTNALAEEFPEIHEARNANYGYEATIGIGTSVDEYLKGFVRIRDRAREMLANRNNDSNLRRVGKDKAKSNSFN
ncbi:dynein axonemal intermediate chain 3 [Ptiloglossa arizonensis]|uniref:dynein axonemal intermediate chain 3 n=1 Tax=Ptiloglossa arizonensis TaxID=3350558 RepID=UPI003F9F14EE